MCIECWTLLAAGVLACATVWLAFSTRTLTKSTVQMAHETREASVRQLGVQTWFHLAARFDSKEIRIARGRLAERLEDYDLSKHDEITEEVLDVFEDIGTVYKFGLINEENKKPSRLNRGTVFCSLKLLDFNEHRVHKQ